MRYDVEEHLTGEGRDGIGQGPATGTYGSEEAALAAMAEAKARGNGATCIVRDDAGRGTMHRLGLVRAIPEDAPPMPDVHTLWMAAHRQARQD